VLYGSSNSGKPNLAQVFSILRKALLGEEKLDINRPVFGGSPIVSFEVAFNNRGGLSWLVCSFTCNQASSSYICEKLAERSYYETAPFATKY